MTHLNVKNSKFGNLDNYTTSHLYFVAMTLSNLQDKHKKLKFWHNSVY